MSLRLIEAGTIVEINRLTVKLHGGTFLPPDNLRPGQGLGFVEQIRSNQIFGQVLYPTPHHRSAAYLYYICKNHSFHDGNKRTGLACALTLLEWNGLEYKSLEPAPAEEFVLGIATSLDDPGVVIDRIASWLRP